MKERAGIQSVEVGFALLQVLADAEGPLMLRDLARAAAMSAAKAHRYLVSFQRLQLVVQDAASTRYDLGPAALKLGLASLSRLDAVRLARERIARLTGREKQILDAVLLGRHNREIAGELNISVRTVEVYKSRMMDKMQVTRLAELVRLFARTESR